MKSLWTLIILLFASSTMQTCLHDVIHPETDDVSDDDQDTSYNYDVTTQDDDVVRKRRQTEVLKDAKLGDFYKRMRLKLWFDFENIDLNFEERNRLEEQTMKAAEKLSDTLRGLFFSEKQ